MFRSWGIARKIGCSLLLFLVPVAYLLWSLVGAGQVVIDTARAEVLGEIFLKPLRDVQAAALQTMLTHRSQPALMDALQNVRVAQQQTAGRLAADETLHELEGALHALVLAPDDPASQDAAAATIERLTAHVRDSSGLILDPEIDSFYLMDASVVALPSLMDQVARVGILQARPAGGTEQAAVARTLAESELAHLRKAFDAAVAADSADRTDQMERIGSEIERLARSLTAFLDGSGSTFRQGDRSEPAGLIRSLASLGNMLDEELLLRLEGRIARAERDGAWMLAVTSVLFGLAGFGIGMLLLTTVVRPIRAVTHSITMLAGGQAGVEVPHREQLDEVGALARAADIFKERYAIDKQRTQRIADLVRAFEQKAAQLADKVSGSSDRLGKVAKGLHNGAIDTVRQMKTAQDSAKTTTDNMAVMTDASGHLTASIGAISDVVESNNVIIERAVKTVDAAVSEAVKLADAARTIGGIVEVIQQIAGQTSLLALNATIEAARVGVAGRGFAVVAGEVKNLAGQTARATADISAQILSVQEAARASIDAIRSIGETVQDINASAVSIVGRVDQQREVTKVITDNIMDAGSGAPTAFASIGSVQEAVANVEVVAGEVLAEADELTRQATLLRVEVDRFGNELQAA